VKVVLYASVAIEVALGRGQAERLAGVLEEADVVLAPELFVPEVVHTIWKYQQFEGVSLGTCERAIETALALVDGLVSSKETYGEAFSSPERRTGPRTKCSTSPWRGAKTRCSSPPTLPCARKRSARGCAWREEARRPSPEQSFEVRAAQWVFWPQCVIGFAERIAPMRSWVVLVIMMLGSSLVANATTIYDFVASDVGWTFTLTVPNPVTADTTFSPPELTCSPCSSIKFVPDAVAAGLTGTPSQAIAWYRDGSESYFYYSPGTFTTAGVYNDIILNYGTILTVTVNADPIPEPSTGALLVAPLLAGFVLRRRRR
jgi:hypothetical protein